MAAHPRFCEAWSLHGLPLAQGTLTDGLHKIAALFEPLMQALTRAADGRKALPWRRNAMEVFEEVEGKTGIAGICG